MGQTITKNRNLGIDTNALLIPQIQQKKVDTISNTPWFMLQCRRYQVSKLHKDTHIK